MSLKTLTELGIEFNTDKATDHHFTQIYETYFSKLRDKELNIFEIGVWDGGSVRTLKEYFKTSKVYAVDWEDKKHLREDRITIERGDQTDVNFMTNVFADVKFDIIIDDGGHTMLQQQVSLETMLPRLLPGGIYILEDLHTSTDINYGGCKEYRNGKTTLHLIEHIVKNIKPESDSFFIKDFNIIKSQIETCEVFATNNGTSITSVLRKKS